MDKKVIIPGFVGFVFGVIAVSIVSSNNVSPQPTPVVTHSETTMTDMVHGLHGQTGDNFDKAFIQMMIEHHQGAIDMAKQASASAKHQEIKDLSKDIIFAQEKEILQMQQWRNNWEY